MDNTFCAAIQGAKTSETSGIIAVKNQTASERILSSGTQVNMSQLNPEHKY